VGVVNDAAEFALWLSRTSGQYGGCSHGAEDPDDEVNDICRALAEMADASGGGLRPPQIVGTVRTGRTTDP